MWMFLLACNPTAAPLGSVRHATDHPDVPRLAMTAFSVPEQLGVGPDGTTWVVPLRDVGAGEVALDEPTLWMMPGTEEPLREGWLEKLRLNVDDHARTYFVAGRLDRMDSSHPAVLAIRDAEARHGVRSHPRAAILYYPPPSE